MTINASARAPVYTYRYDVARYLTECLVAKLSPFDLSRCLSDFPTTTYPFLQEKIDELPHNLDPEGEQFKDRVTLCKKTTELIFKALLATDFANVRSDLNQNHVRMGILALLATVFNFWNSFGLTTYGWLPTLIAIIWLSLVYSRWVAEQPKTFTQSGLAYQPYKSKSVEDENIYAWICTIFLSVQMFLFCGCFYNL